MSKKHYGLWGGIFLTVDVENLLILGITPYIFMAGIGFMFAFSCFVLLAAIKGYDIKKNTIYLLVSCIGLFVGAKLFGIITKIIATINAKEIVELSILMNTGIVFYGGLIGFVLTFICLAKILDKHIDFYVMDIIAVCIPLFHSFARAGCFMAGCCYGIESHGFTSVLYRTSLLELTQRIPVQLIETGINLLIFIVLLILYIKNRFSKTLLLFYFSVYSIFRFFLEFLRGDISRGFIGFLSFSQVISLFLLLLLVIIAIKSRKRRCTF